MSRYQSTFVSYVSCSNLHWQINIPWAKLFYMEKNVNYILFLARAFHAYRENDTYWQYMDYVIYFHRRKTRVVGSWSGLLCPNGLRKDIRFLKWEHLKSSEATKEEDWMILSTVWKEKPHQNDHVTMAKPQIKMTHVKVAISQCYNIV